MGMDCQRSCLTVSNKQGTAEIVITLGQRMGALTAEPQDSSCYTDLMACRHFLFTFLPARLERFEALTSGRMRQGQAHSADVEVKRRMWDAEFHHGLVTAYLTEFSRMS